MPRYVEIVSPAGVTRRSDCTSRDFMLFSFRYVRYVLYSKLEIASVGLNFPQSAYESVYPRL